MNSRSNRAAIKTSDQDCKSIMLTIKNNKNNIKVKFENEFREHETVTSDLRVEKSIKDNTWKVNLYNLKEIFSFSFLFLLIFSSCSKRLSGYSFSCNYSGWRLINFLELANCFSPVWGNFRSSCLQKLYLPQSLSTT